MTSEFQNKVAVVTGASRGIGKGIALELARNGASIAIVYRSEEEKALVLRQPALVNVAQVGIGAARQEPRVGFVGDVEDGEVVLGGDEADLATAG